MQLSHATSPRRTRSALPRRAPCSHVVRPALLTHASALPLPSHARLVCRRLACLRFVRRRHACTTCPPPSLSPPPILSFPRPSSLPPLSRASSPPFVVRQTPPPPSFSCLFCTTSSLSAHHIRLLHSSPSLLSSLPFLLLLPSSTSFLSASPATSCCRCLSFGDRAPISSYSAPSPSSSSYLSPSTSPTFSPLPPPLFSPYLLQLVADYVLSTTFPPLVSPLSGAAADYTVIPPLVSPLSGAAPDYSTVIPPPLVSPLSGAAEDYSTIIPPPLVSPVSGAEANYSTVIPPPLVSPPIGSAADYFTPIPPPHVSPTNGSAADYIAPFPPLFVTMPSQDSILGASPLMDSRFVVPLPPPFQSTTSHSPSPTAAALSLLRTLDFVLDSAATDFVFRDAGVLRNFHRPLSIDGAGETMTKICIGTSSLHCPASPSGAVTGLYVPSCRELYCDLHYHDWHLARFTLSPSTRLYTLRVPIPSSVHHTSPHVSSCDCRSLTQPTLLLHHRLGHPNFPLLRSMVTSKLLHDLPPSLPPLTPSPAPLCTPCVQAKLSQSPHPSSPSASPKPLDVVHMDLWGPSPIASREGYRYFLLLVDDHSCFATVYPLCAKSDAPSLIIRWAEQARLRFGRRVARFHSDGGGDFFNHSLLSYCSSHGIRQTSTLPHSPEQNGVAERRIRTLMEITRCLLTHASAPHSLWSYALVHATLLSNLRPHPLHPSNTPFQLWTSRQPTARPLRVWGCVAHVLINPADRARHGGKLAPKSQLSAHSQQDVIFDETCSPFLTHPPIPPPPSLHWCDFDPLRFTPPSPSPLPPPPALPPLPAPSTPPSAVISGTSPPPSSSSAPMPSSSPPTSATLPSAPAPPPSPRLTRSMTHAMSNFQHSALFIHLSPSQNVDLLEDRFEELFSVHPVSPLLCVTIGNFSNSPTLLSVDTAAIPTPQTYSEAVSGFHET
ncbi:unnamed protein product [Closterium sp. NIES-54]